MLITVVCKAKHISKSVNALVSQPITLVIELKLVSYVRRS